jgi:Bifunctional DNA primase/polymerase, N-terminal/AAA domain
MLMNAALKYAADGFAVFPVYEPERHHGGLLCSCGKDGCRGKHPRTVNGVNDATTDADIIRGWWTKWPDASIGMATGAKSGVSVVDLDGAEGILSGKQLGILSNVTALTGNGKQLFFADTGAGLKNTVKKLAAGVDTRGDGGYVVVPPSLHPNGKRYAWQGQPLNRKSLTSIGGVITTIQKSVPPANLNGNLSPSKPESWISEALGGMRNGNIDTTLVSVLGRLRRDGYSERDAFCLLDPHAKAAGATPGHLEEKIKYLWSKYPSTLKSFSTSKSETIDTFLQDIQEPEWICKPFIAKKSIGFVVGLPATLKTWLCIDLAVESARENGSWIGLFPATNCKVLFIDQERWKGETQRRFSAVLVAKNISHSDLKGRLFLKSGTTIRLNLDQSYQSFRTELLDLRPDLIIVDSFATFHTLPENDRTEIQKVLERVKELRNEIGCTFLFINHENKSAYPNGEPEGVPTMGTMVGSVGIGAAAEFCLTVRRVDDNTSIVHHTKSTLASTAKAFYASVVDVPEGIVVRGLND